MKNWICLVPLVSLLAAASAQPYAINAGRLVDGTGASVRHGLYVTVQDGRISAISATKPGNLPVKEFSSATVMPGFVDAHGHISFIGLGEDADAQLVNANNREQWASCNARDALASGVTTLRDPGSYLWTLAMRPRIEATGLRWITAGRQLVKKAPGAYLDEMFVEFDGVDNARAEVRARKQEGSDFIKLRLTRQRPLPTLEEARAIVDEAHRIGIKVAVHTDVPFDEAVHLAVAAGADSIEHNATLRVADPDKTFPEIVRRQIIVVPGIGSWVAHFEPLWLDPKQILEEPLRSKLPPVLLNAMQSHAEELRQQALDSEKNGFDAQKRRTELRAETLRAYKAGVLLAAGPDTGVDLMPHGRLYKDIEWYVETGIPIEKVVQIATLNGARAAGIEKETGSLEVGKDADIVVLDGDLTRDASVFQRVALVIRAGRVAFDASQKWAPCTISGTAPSK
ncbi:MAG: amidohydrolase family protein [Terriglobales bacterium]